MHRFDGTAVRQLDLLDEAKKPLAPGTARRRPTPNIRLLQKDVYAELARRRRRAQIAARHLIEGR